MMVEIMRELIAAQADHRVDGILIRYGVSPAITPIAGMAAIQTVGNFYEPEPAGRPAIIMPIMDGGELVDLLAFDPRQPADFKVRLGACPLLGIDNTGLCLEPLHVWRTPLGYLQANLEGVVVLSAKDARTLLNCCDKLIAEDVPHGQEIRDQLMQAPRGPQIAVPAEAVQR